MTTLIPPTLEDIGFVLFGSSWKEPLANELNVNLEDVEAWVVDPSAIPANIEVGITQIGQIRIQEIQFMLQHMGETRLDRSIPDEADDED